MESYLEMLQRYLAQIDEGQLIKAATIIKKATARKKSVFIFGNGGSMATAMHFAEDLTHIGVRAIALSNISQITMLANDYGYPYIFINQLECLMKKGDVAIGISCSGDSPNVTMAIEYANKFGPTIGLTAFDGGVLKDLARFNIHVSTALGDFGPAEDTHLAICHMICGMVKEWK